MCVHRKREKNESPLWASCSVYSLGSQAVCMCMCVCVCETEKADVRDKCLLVPLVPPSVSPLSLLYRSLFLFHRFLPANPLLISCVCVSPQAGFGFTMDSRH